MMLNPEQRVRNAIAEVLGVPHEKVVDDANLSTDLDADSLDSVDVTMAIEDELGIELSDELCAQCETVGDWVKMSVEAVQARG